MTMPGHCRLTAWHPPHIYIRIRDGHLLASCPGVEHDHSKRCCTTHNHHTSPHVGCVLR